MPEFPIIFTHNILQGAKLSGDDIPGHELERLRDGHRHTWWEAPGTVQQNIEIRAQSLIINPDFEISTVGWAKFFAGGGVGTFARNTVSPIEGVADALIIATTADASADVLGAVVVKPIFMNANRTYRIMFRALVQDAGAKNLRVGLLKEGLIEDAAFYTTKSIGLTDAGYFQDFTPTADGWFHPYVRCLEPQTLQLDEVIINEVRDIDTIMIDAGHTMSLASIIVQFRNNEATTFANVAAQSQNQWTNLAPVYITFTGQKALSWNIKISVFTLDPGVEVARVPIMFLGKRWEVPHHFSGAFDPDMTNRVDDLVTGERGVSQRTLKYTRRIFRAAFSNINATHYLDVERFFEDTDTGSRGFFFNWQPTSKPNDWLFMRIRDSREVPHRNGALRDWQLDFEEIVGKRII